MAKLPKPILLPWQRKRKREQRPRRVTNMKFYNSSAWRKHSKRYRQENPLCEVSKVMGNIRAAHVVDHIIPINQGGAKLDERNHMALSKWVHDYKSALESHTPILVPYTNTFEGKLPKDKRDIIKLLITRINGR